MLSVAADLVVASKASDEMVRERKTERKNKEKKTNLFVRDERAGDLSAAQERGRGWGGRWHIYTYTKTRPWMCPQKTL